MSLAQEALEDSLFFLDEMLSLVQLVYILLEKFFYRNIYQQIKSKTNCDAI